MKKLITWTSLILAASLFAEPGDDKGQLKRSMKVVPLSSAYLSTENGGANHASTVLADGIGIYTTQEDEYSKAIAHLNEKYGDDALKDEKSLKEYVLDTGTAADKELANKLNLATVQKSNPGDSCDDGNPQTDNDIYLDENFTCKGKKIYNSVKCYGKPIGSQFEFEGKTYLVVDNTATIKSNLNRAETLCTSNVTNMSNLFKNNTSFNRPIGNWDTSNVTSMSSMFEGATLFNQPIGDWDTSNVTNMAYMFYGASSFNQPIEDWDTGNVMNMNNMLYDADSFNQAIGDLDTSNVTNMYRMFMGANSFNQPIGDWNTSNVTDMSHIFRDATSFNQPIGKWDTSNVTDMSYMFFYATQFNQTIENWITSKVTSYTGFATGSALTSANAPSKNETKFPTSR